MKSFLAAHLRVIALNSLLFLISLFSIGTVHALIPGGQANLHEALIPQIVPSPLLQSFPAAPPQQYDEEITPKPDPSMIWIPGYWTWNPVLEDYKWTCGVWRVPPADHQWIPGYWTNIGVQGWVWVQGFWSKIPLAQLTYIPKALPEIPEENPGIPRGRLLLDPWILECGRFPFRVDIGTMGTAGPSMDVYSRPLCLEAGRLCVDPCLLGLGP